ncbi:MAG: adventurous gliding motility protein CglF [Deltaproteobacteria bacterium]|nr:adventurous gliding motility protein CglF [Deltaproteobacteria bacterium]
MRRKFGLLGLAALILGGLLLVWPAGAAAQDVSYKKKTEYSFDEDTVSGDLTRPDGEYVEARKKVRHSNLIKIREHFRDKVLQSVGEL